ncbi:hypothetical protein Cni_G01408 [Canna indica]|uniref:Uncharacterized protein n=1 Tax=Canna indica TaxID=4628 RepID=A0AAQ3JP89_9LILI|nr:hypothetical protein Cni_G01408 [Canna indica]
MCSNVFSILIENIKGRALGNQTSPVQSCHEGARPPPRRLVPQLDPLALCRRSRCGSEAPGGGGGGGGGSAIDGEALQRGAAAALGEVCSGYQRLVADPRKRERGRKKERTSGSDNEMGSGDDFAQGGRGEQ